MVIRYLLIEIILLVFTQNIFAQTPISIDQTIDKIFNLDFEKVPSDLADIGKANPAMASYLQIDYLWWKMVSHNSATNESDFLEFLNSFKQKKSGLDSDFERLTFFVYQIRYDNFKKLSFSRYITAFKFHFFLGNMDGEKAEKFNSLEKSIFQMTLEFDNYIKFKYLNDYGISSKRNLQQSQLCLQNIEKMHNEHYRSFEAIKTYFLGKIYFEIENDYLKAFRKFDALSTDFPENTIFKTIRENCRVQMVMNSK
jgi:hypothetical protein